MTAVRRAIGGDWAGLLAVLVLGGVAAAFLSPSFLTEFNIYVMLRSASVAVLVAFSQMIMLAVGQMNLSVGALGGLVAVLFGGMLERLGLPLILAIPLALLVGVAGGLINGVLTSRTGVNGFIVTLATGSAFTGINLGLTESKPFHGVPREFVALGDSHWDFIPALLWPPLIVAPLLGVFLYHLKAGRWLLAVGGNPSAAQLSGVSADSMVILAHAISGGLSGLAAILAVAQLGAAQPETGAGWLLVSFAGPIIGGASLAGGSVSITGAFLAVLVIALIENVLVLANVDPYWVQFMLGALIMLTVGINRWRAIRAART
ncbi:MAG TPA: ABC transporter permease [Roseiarcus sp.]|nr:ABC transporter permease [Roseiarcus sp.]